MRGRINVNGVMAHAEELYARAKGTGEVRRPLPSAQIRALAEALVDAINEELQWVRYR